MIPRYDITTRASEIPIIKENRLLWFRKIIGVESEAEEVKAFQFTLVQFVTVAIMYQLNIHHLVNFLDIVLTNSELLVFIAFVVIQIGIGIPLLMLFLFMSSYSKKGLLKFWDCVPMFQGLGYSLVLCRLTYAVYQVQFTIMAGLMMWDFLVKSDISENYQSCSNESKHMCISMYPNTTLDLRCHTPMSKRIVNESVYFKTQYHYRYDVLRYHRFELSNIFIKYDFLILGFLIWLAVFSISVFGVHRIARIAVHFQLVWMCALAFISVYTIALSEDPIVPREYMSDTTEIDFWIKTLLHATDLIVVTDMIFVGTMKPSGASPVQCGLIVGSVKLIVYVIAIFFTQRCIQAVLGHYRFEDTNCLIAFGHDFLFAFLPDVLYRVHFGVSFMFLWHAGFFFGNVVTVVFSVIGIVQGITEKFTVLRRYRIFVFGTVSSVGFLGTVYSCTNLGLNTWYAYWANGNVYYTTVIFLTMNLALMFIYSTKRIVEDYTFTYGSPPNRYWIAAWQTAPIIALFTFIFMMYQLKELSSVSNFSAGMMLWSYVHCTLIILPIFAQFLVKCFTHVKYRTLSTVTKPAESWGPDDPIRKRDRSLFYPQRDVRYRNQVLTCLHRCITNTPKYEAENMKQEQKLNLLLHQLREGKELGEMSDLLLK